VLRGGAFNNNDNNVRCADRNNNTPDNANINNGFRVVLSTFFIPAGNARRLALRGSGPRRKMAGPAPGRARNRAGGANTNGLAL